MKMRTLLVIVASAVCGSLIYSCSSDSNENSSTYISPCRDTVHGGQTWSWQQDTLTVIEDTYLMADSECTKKLFPVKVGEAIYAERSCQNTVLQNGWEQTVLKVYYGLPGKIKEGYLSQKYMGTYPLLIDENTRLIIGFAPDKKNNGFNLRLLLCDKSFKKISETSTLALGGEFSDGDENADPKLWYGHYMEASVSSNTRGLEGVEKFILVSEGYDACGYVGGTSYVAWNGKKLMPTASEDGMSDAGVFYGEGRLIFPGDKRGLEGKIIKEIVNVETDDAYTEDSIADGVEGAEVMVSSEHYDSTIVHYTWNSKKGVTGFDTVLKYVRVPEGKTVTAEKVE